MSAFPHEGDTFDRYRIVGRLGHGAMGVVFRALQSDLNREVALKVLSPQYAEESEFRERFKREASILASVDSPHIINIFDYGEKDGCLFIATQLVKGGDLGEVLRRDGPMPVSTAVDLLAQLAGGLADAHEAGVVHRDVKPSNVLLRYLGDDVHAYLCDFGVARSDDEGLTQAGVVVGSYGFMSPERLRGDTATPQSDLYSLGCLLVTSLTGQLPYTGTDMQVAQLHMSGPIPQWEETTPVMASLNAVLRRAMAKNVEDRYQSAHDMRDDLLAARDLLRRPQVAAPVEPTVHRAALPASVTGPAPPRPPARPRRGRTQWVVGVAVGLLVLVGGVAWVNRPDGLGWNAAWGSDGETLTPSTDGRSVPDPTTTSPPASTTPKSAPPSATSPTTTAPPTTNPNNPSDQPSATNTTPPPERPSPSSPAPTCWNGAAEPPSGRCSEPNEDAGVPDMFRTLDKLRCDSQPPDPRKLEEWVCPEQLLADGETVHITYSKWDDWGSADDHYANHVYEADGQVRGPALLLGPKSVKDDTKVRSSLMYPKTYPSPFSVTVLGDDLAAVEEGVEFVLPDFER